MCVVGLAWNAHANWLLLAAGNRDELHSRPSAELSRWEGANHVIAGRDLQAGGTWMGISETGRFAVVTNIATGQRNPAAKSRGMLAALFLLGTNPLDTAAELAHFNPFNLLTVDGSSVKLLANHPRPLQSDLAPGIYAMANGPLDEPCARVGSMKALLVEWLGRGRAQTSPLLDELADGGRRDMRDPQAALFTRNPAYGTRSSTVVAIDREGSGVIVERRYTPDGIFVAEMEYAFSWPAEGPR